MRIVLVIIFVVSCSGSNAIKRRNLDHLYIGGSHAKYFLADLPSWANFSSVSECKLSNSIKYLNFENLYRSYGLSYEKLVQFQYLFNKKIEEYKVESKNRELILQDEAYIFFNVQEQILGGAKAFIKPNYKNINLFWIDPALKNDKLRRKIIKAVKSKSGQSGYPIFLSRCLNTKGIEKFVIANKIDDLGIKYMNSYMFSPYNKFMKLGAKFQINIMEILKGKKVQLFAPSYPKFISNKVKFIKI